LAGAQLVTALADRSVPAPTKKGKQDTKAEKVSNALTAQAGDRVAKDALAAAEAAYNTAKAATGTAKATRDKLQGPFREARTASEDAPEDNQKKEAFEKLKTPFEAAQKAFETATKEEATAKKAYEAAQAEEKTATKASTDETAGAVAAGAAAGLTSAGASAEDASSAYAAIAANYAQEKAKYLDLLMKLQDQESETLSKIASFAVQMTTERGNEQLEQAAVESLHIAVGVLKHVVTILGEVTLFWTQMAVACRALAGDALRENIKIYMKRSREERITEYSKPDFQLSMLQVAAQWHALQLVASDYRAATMRVYTKLGETYKQNPSIQEARAQAKVLAANLKREIDDELKASDAAKKQLETAKAETKKITDAANAAHA